MKRYETHDIELTVDGKALLTTNDTWLSDAILRKWLTSPGEVFEAIVEIETATHNTTPPSLRAVRVEVPGEVLAMMREELPIARPETQHAWIGATLEGIPIDLNDDLPVRQIRWTFADGSTRLDRV